MRQVLALTLSAVTITSALTLAFAPITLFLRLTAQNYPLFVLVNVMILAFTGFTGLSFLLKGTRRLNELAAADDITQSGTQFVNRTLLVAWVCLFGFVGTQLAWTLRPFFGELDKPFIFFHKVEGNFYLGVLELLAQLLGGGVR